MGAAAANETSAAVSDTNDSEDDEERPAARSRAARPVAIDREARGTAMEESSETADHEDDVPQEQSRAASAKTEIEASGAETRETPDYESPEELVARRAVELQQQLPEKSRGRVTMAVGIVETDNGDKTTVVGTSEPRGYLRPGVSLEKGEVVAPGSGHAETDIIDWAEQREQSVTTIGAGRPICPNCAEAIRRVDAQPATRLKEEM